MAAGLFAALTMSSAAAGETYRLLSLEGSLVKWGAPAAGTRARVTYALIDGARDFPGARNCEAMEPLSPVLQRNRVTPEVFQRELKAAFEAWSRAADIVFVPAGGGHDADILIGALRHPRGRAFTNVAYDDAVQGGMRSISQSLICLNPAVPWKVGFDGNSDIYDLRYTLMHEIGHAIGLDHPGPSGTVMSFKYQEDHRELQSGDIFGASALYGASRVLTAGADSALARPLVPANASVTPAPVPSLSLGDDSHAPRVWPVIPSEIP